MKQIKTCLFIKPFFLVIFLIAINLVICGKCGADQIKKRIKPGPLKAPGDNNRRRLDSRYTPIRIYADYSNLRETSSIDSNTLQRIRRLIDETCNEFSKFLKVAHYSVDLTGLENTIKEQCAIDSIGSGYANYLKIFDVVIFPSFDSTLGIGVLAAAGLCLYSSLSFRPYMGVLLINPELSFTKANTELYMKNLLFHELTHVLIFDPDLFNVLGMSTVKIFDGSFVTFVNSPRVLTKARQHFNCTTLNGIPLENQGSEGSAGAHWEARYMLGDYMISTDYIENILSDITLALFEDSGLYKVEYYSGGLFKFGKNAGCSFFNQKCIENGQSNFPNEFCTNFNGDFCTRSRGVKGQCLVFHHQETIPSRYRYFENKKDGGFRAANYCPVSILQDDSNDYYPSNCNSGTSSLDSEYGEVIGNSSFCFISSLLPSSSSLTTTSQAICYNVKCDKANKQLIVNIGSNSVICPTEGGTLSDPAGFRGSIDCPEYTDICGYESDDNSICNEMFDCLSSKVETDVRTYSYFPLDEDFADPIYIINNSRYLNINYMMLFLILFLI